YSGQRFNQKMNIPVNHVEPWYTHDISVAREFVVSNLSARLMFELNNVLDQHYDVVANFPMPGRYFRISASINL
ncbi:MAG: TonB-dependent receptor, partial [Flavitalea sp.]